MQDNVDQPAATDRDALAVILEALDIPYAASVGDEEIRAKIVDERLLHTLTMLRRWLDDRASGKRDDDHFAWSLAYLRERLAEHPATGYRTDYAQVMADWTAERAGKGLDLDATGLPNSGSDGCPDWCEVDDHEAADGSALTRHEMSYGVDISALPYVVPSCGDRAGGEFFEAALAVLRQDVGSDPVIAIQMPEPRDDPNPANGVGMTLAEAAHLRDSLTELINTAGGHQSVTEEDVIILVHALGEATRPVQP